MKIEIVLEHLDGSLETGTTSRERAVNASIIIHNGKYFTYVPRPHSPITFREVQPPYLLTDWTPVA